MSCKKIPYKEFFAGDMICLMDTWRSVTHTASAESMQFSN